MKRLTNGSIIEIHVRHEYYTYAQALKKGFIAIFDAKYSTPIHSMNSLNACNVLFIINASISDMINKGEWSIRGKLPINPQLQNLPFQFIQDAINPNKFLLYNCETGETFLAKREECEGLERCAIWYGNHIEDRIYSHYNNTKCEWVTSINEWMEQANTNN